MCSVAREGLKAISVAAAAAAVCLFGDGGGCDIEPRPEEPPICRIGQGFWGSKKL